MQRVPPQNRKQTAGTRAEKPLSSSEAESEYKIYVVALYFNQSALGFLTYVGNWVPLVLSTPLLTAAGFFRCDFVPGFLGVISQEGVDGVWPGIIKATSWAP